MVEVATKFQTPGERQKERLSRLRKLQKRPGLRVEPATPELRRALKHPSGIKFRSAGSVEWPDDIFTRRRIKDGSVKVVEQKTEAKSSSARSRASEKGE